MAGRPIVRLVNDDGEWFSRGDRVRLHRTLSTPQELHAVRDADGPYEVMGCTPRRSRTSACCNSYCERSARDSPLLPAVTRTWRMALGVPP